MKNMTFKELIFQYYYLSLGFDKNPDNSTNNTNYIKNIFVLGYDIQ